MKDNKITAEKSQKQNKGSIAIHITTGFIVLAVCVGILLLAMIKPYDKAKVYLNIAFMDELKTTPESIGNGLIIKNNAIVEGYKGETYEEGEFIRPSFGEHYATLKCDVIGIDVPIYWGSNISLFELGACQSSGSVIVGSDGNTVISAHEDTYFNKLSELKVGDKITINATYGEFSYTVRELISFKKTNSKYVVPTEDNRLTLYTCKKDVFGSPDERIGVICDLTEKKFYTPLKEEN